MIFFLRRLARSCAVAGGAHGKRASANGRQFCLTMKSNVAFSPVADVNIGFHYLS